MDLAGNIEATAAPGVISHGSFPPLKDRTDVENVLARDQPSEALNHSKELSTEISTDMTIEFMRKKTDSEERLSGPLESVPSPANTSISKKALRPKPPVIYKFEPFDEAILLAPPADSDHVNVKDRKMADSQDPSKSSKPGKKRGRPFKLDAQGNPINVKGTSSPLNKKKKMKPKKTTNINAAPKLDINAMDQPFAKIQKQNILKLRADDHRRYLDEHIMGPLYRSLQKILSEKPDRPLQTLANLLLEEDKRLSNNSIL